MSIVLFIRTKTNIELVGDQVSLDLIDIESYAYWTTSTKNFMPEITKNHIFLSCQQFFCLVLFI
jgi:hypothetical protein